MIATPAHLGGHMQMSWVDEPVLDYLISRYNVRSMLDVGCGLGAMVDMATAKGIIAYGVDGDPQVEHPDVFIHDYTTGPTALWFENISIFERTVVYDLIWCVEFVEHVEQQYQENYLRTFDRGTKALYLTAAYPGQGGYHHVNEQPMEYWIELLTARGWTLDQEATDWVHEHGAIPFSQMTGLVFVRG